MAVGTWAMRLHTFRLSDMGEATSEALGGEAIPRSLLLALFDGQPFLLCALGDGQLYNFHIDPKTGASPTRAVARMLELCRLNTSSILRRLLQACGAMIGAALFRCAGFRW